MSEKSNFGEDINKDTNCLTMAVSPCDNCSTSGTSQQNSPLQGHSWCNQWCAKSWNQKGYCVVISNVGVHTFYHQDVLINYRPACGYVVHQTSSYDLKLHQTKAMEKEEALVKIIGLIWYVQPLVMDCWSWPSPPFMPQVSFVLRLQPLWKYRIWNASGKSGTRVKGKSTTISTNGLAPKKKHTAGGSNLMPEIEHLLASRSNWYEIDSTPQNQYPGVFPPENPDSPSPGLKRMGHIVDCSKLPQFTEGNPHRFLYQKPALKTSLQWQCPRSCCWWQQAERSHSLCSMSRCAQVWHPQLHLCELKKSQKMSDSSYVTADTKWQVSSLCGVCLPH